MDYSHVDFSDILPRVKEPATPAAASRLTLKEKQLITSQRQLSSAIASGDETSLVEALCDLGYFHKALQIATLPANVEWVTRLVEAQDNVSPCDCPPTSVVLKEGPTSFSKAASNYSMVKEYPQGVLWRCACCGNQILLSPSTFPNSQAQRELEMRITYPQAGKGPDHQVLLNPVGECESCPKE